MLRFLCQLNRHLPDRQQARWDGRSYVSTCRRCGAAIRRRKHNRWEQDWLEGLPEGGPGKSGSWEAD